MRTGVGRTQTPESLEKFPAFFDRQAVPCLHGASACFQGEAQEVGYDFLMIKQVALGQCVKHAVHGIGDAGIFVEVAQRSHLESVVSERFEFDPEFREEVHVFLQDLDVRWGNIDKNGNDQLLG